MEDTVHNKVCVSLEIISPPLQPREKVTKGKYFLLSLCLVYKSISARFTPYSFKRGPLVSFKCISCNGCLRTA